MGSSIAMAAGLGLTLVVFLFLPEYADRLQPEKLPLLGGFAWSLLLAASSAAAFLGEIRRRPWRRLPLVTLLVAAVGMAWVYWPRG